MLCTSFCVINAQEVSCRVIRPSPYFDISGGNFAYKGELQTGEIVTATKFIVWIYFPPEDDKRFIIHCIKDGYRYRMFPQNLVPAATDTLFGQDVLTDTTTFSYNDSFFNYNIYPCKEMWVPVHYVDVLRSKDRETLPKYEPRLLDYDKNMGYEEMYGSSEWYDIMYSGIENGMLVFFNPIIYSYGGEFLIKTIEKHEYGYVVECFVPRDIHDKLTPPNRLMPYFNWDLCTGETVTMTLYVDGEYMEIYMNGTDPQHKFGTIVKVKEEFIKQYMDLIKKGICDLTNVQWPRRADGSTDYSIPTSATSVLEEAKQPELIELSVDSIDTETMRTIQNSAKTSAIPLWARLAITGGAVIIAGGVVVFILKRRK